MNTVYVLDTLNEGLYFQASHSLKREHLRNLCDKDNSSMHKAVSLAEEGAVSWRVGLGRAFWKRSTLS